MTRANNDNVPRHNTSDPSLRPMIWPIMPFLVISETILACQPIDLLGLVSFENLAFRGTQHQISIFQPKHMPVTDSPPTVLNPLPLIRATPSNRRLQILAGYRHVVGIQTHQQYKQTLCTQPPSPPHNQRWYHPP